jgi:hypothetical protein
MNRFCAILILTALVAACSKQPSQNDVQHAQVRQAQEDLLTGRIYRDRDGAAEARADIQEGKPKWKVYADREGLDTKERTKLFREKLGVEIELMVSSYYVDRYADTYDTEINKYLTSKFGPDAIKQIDDEA